MKKLLNYLNDFNGSTSVSKVCTEVYKIRQFKSGIHIENMESETISANADSTMSEECDAETSRSHQTEDILGKYKDK